MNESGSSILICDEVFDRWRKDLPCIIRLRCKCKQAGHDEVHQTSVDDGAARYTEPISCEPVSASAVAMLTAHNAEVDANVQKDGKPDRIHALWPLVG